MKPKIKIKKDSKFGKAAKKITAFRLNIIFERADKYIGDNDVENLHKLRISVRRLRYVFELFESCYPKKRFLYVLNYLKHLQDVIGSVRDIDVIKYEIKSISEQNNIPLPKELMEFLQKNKNEMSEKISKELVKFKNDKIIQSLLN